MFMYPNNGNVFAMSYTENPVDNTFFRVVVQGVWPTICHSSEPLLRRMLFVPLLFFQRLQEGVPPVVWQISEDGIKVLHEY